MSNLVLVLGDAMNHESLVVAEMSKYIPDIKVGYIGNFRSFNKQEVLAECVRNMAPVVAYVLPPETGEPYDEDGECQTVRDHWKRMAESLFTSRSIKELEVVPFDADPSQFWLDGIEQYQSSNREPVVTF